MPTYEYQCSEGHAFEVFQRISDKPRVKCPTCGARATRIISGGAGLIFKGSGFYITDYGKDGKGPRQDSERSESTDAGGKADSPPAAASDSDAKPSPDKPAADKPVPKKTKKVPKDEA
jgi:putative FmdB family regulatory protein